MGFRMPAIRSYSDGDAQKARHNSGSGSPDVGKIEITGNFKLAFDLMEHTDRNLFITGKAGTGKSTLIEYFRNTSKKNVALLAPTGVAALNIKGQTIHSFFGFKPGITVHSVKKLSARRAEIYKNTDTIVIDEISMVRSDLLDCIDLFLRLNGKDRSMPFGGMQVVFIGDLYQLPPIVTSHEKEMFRQHYKSEYFFDANAFRNFPAEFIELDRYYRHSDAKFIELLNSVRNNTAGPDQIKALNERFEPGFDPGVSDGYITLVPRNRLADELNNAALEKLEGNRHTYTATIDGDFDMGNLPADEELNVKVGAQIMFLNNDKYERWVNGSVGYITAINHGDKEDHITARFLDNTEVEVGKHAWELFKFSYNPASHRLIPEVVGRFIQYPIMLAWAVTIHKSQGKTFDRVIIDVGSGLFASGQLYVALSRCRSLEGIVLRRRLEKKHIFTDWRAVKFLTQYQYAKSDERMSLKEKISIIKEAIKTKRAIEITYLKTNDEKSRRTIRPTRTGRFEYMGKSYPGVSGFDSIRLRERNFRIDRILELRVLK